LANWQVDQMSLRYNWVSDIDLIRAQCYKTFYVSNLRMFIIIS
jgi:hypothetical protein